MHAWWEKVWRSERLNQLCLPGAWMIRFVGEDFPQECQKMPADCLFELNQSISQHESITANTWGSVVSLYIWKCIRQCSFMSRMCHHQLDTLCVLLSDFGGKVTIEVYQEESASFNNILFLSVFICILLFCFLQVCVCLCFTSDSCNRTS